MDSNPPCMTYEICAWRMILYSSKKRGYSAASYLNISTELCILWGKHQIWHTSRVSYYEQIWIFGHLKFSLWWLWQPFFKMADGGYCYDAYLLYWRGMQVDGERLFTNKGPVPTSTTSSARWRARDGCFIGPITDNFIGPMIVLLIGSASALQRITSSGRRCFIIGSSSARRRIFSSDRHRPFDVKHHRADAVSSSALLRPDDGFSHRIDIGPLMYNIIGPMTVHHRLYSRPMKNIPVGPSMDNIIGPTTVLHRLYIGPTTDLLIGTTSALRWITSSGQRRFLIGPIAMCLSELYVQAFHRKILLNRYRILISPIFALWQFCSSDLNQHSVTLQINRTIKHRNWYWRQ